MSAAMEALELYPVVIPMTHRFRRVDRREAVLIRGPHGWGEFSPFPDYPAAVTTRWLASALESAFSELPGPKRASIPVNVTVPAVAPDEAAAIVTRSGAMTAKVKVGDPGQSESEDLERLAAVRDSLGAGGRIRIDVNGAWSVAEAESRLAGLAQFDIEYVEQPVATIDEMVELKSRVDVPLAADELIRFEADPFAVVESGAVDVVVLKVQPMGGVARVVDLAARMPVPVVLSSALETSVGLYGGLLAAALLDELPYACGLGTGALLAGDVTGEPLIPVGGYLEVRRPEPDLDLLEKWRPERDVAALLLRKVRAAAEVLT